MRKISWKITVFILIGLTLPAMAYAANTKAVIAYGDGSVQQGTPRYRIYDGSSWGEEKKALSVAADPTYIRWMVLKQCPLRNEYILGTLSGDLKIKVQVYDVASDTWHHLQEIATVGTGQASYRGFDIAYEYDSGHAIIVANNNVLGKPVYWSWDGSNWTNEGSITLPMVPSGTPVWIRLRPWSTGGSLSCPVFDSIMLAVEDTNRNLCYVIWRGLYWETASALQITGTDRPYSYTYQPMDVLTYFCKTPNFRGSSYSNYAYMMARWEEKLASLKYGLCYREATANSISTGTSVYPANPATSASSVHLRWQKAENRAPKKGVKSYLDSIVGTVDTANKLHVQLLKEVSGTGISSAYGTAIGTLQNTGGMGTLYTRNFDVAVESSQAEGLIAWGEATKSNVYYKICNLSGLTIGATQFGLAVSFYPIIVALTADSESDDIFLVIMDGYRQLWAVKWDGASNSWGASTLICNACINFLAYGEPMSLAFHTYLPPAVLTQDRYRWYANTDALQPATALAAENTPITTSDGTILRLRVNVGVTGANLTTPEKFSLQFSTSESGPWQRLASLDTGKVWSRQTPDTTTGVKFTEAALALDSSYRPAIAYYDSINQRMKYTCWNGSSWVSKTNPSAPETILTGYTVYGDTNIVFDAGDTPHLAYCCDKDGDSLSDLGYCKWTGSSWDIQTPLMDSDSLSPGGNKLGSRTAMDLDSAGNPHIAHRDFISLGYTKSSGASWSAEKILDGSENVVSSNTIGMAIDSVNNIHIAYNRTVNSGTRYVKWTGSVWTSPLTINASPLYYYDEYSMDTDKNNYPHLMIGIKHVKWTGSAWITEDLTNTLPPTGANTVKGPSSICMDSSNSPHIVYCYKDDNAPKKRGIRYAWYDGSWHNEIVEETYGESDSYSVRPRALALNGEGVPHFAYIRSIDTMSVMRYATKIDPSGFRGYDNPVSPDGATISGCLLAGSSDAETYEEVNSSASMPNPISQGSYGEWDWVIKIEGACSGATYYFRMTKDSDESLAYTRYPSVTIAGGPSKGRITHWEEIR